MDEIIRLKDLSVSLDGRKVLHGLDLTVMAGEAVAVVGPNGSGKTTLLRTLATLIRPVGGEGNVLGADLRGPARLETRSRIGLISHIPGLIEDLSLRENLIHFSRVAGHDETRADQALDVVGLSQVARRRVSESSFGMQRRAEIAWLLIARPALLLLDEARSGLDEDASELIDVITQRAIADHGAVVAVSHQEAGLGVGFTRLQRLSNGSLEPVR